MFTYDSDEQTRTLMTHTVQRTRESGFKIAPVDELLTALSDRRGSEWRTAALAAFEVAVHERGVPSGEESRRVLDPVADNVSSWDLYEHMLTAWRRCGPPGVSDVLLQTGATARACQGAALVALLGQVNAGANPEDPRVQQWNGRVRERIDTFDRGWASTAYGRRARLKAWAPVLVTVAGVALMYVGLLAHPLPGIVGVLLLLAGLAHFAMTAGVGSTDGEGHRAVIVAVLGSTMGSGIMVLYGFGYVETFVALPDWAVSGGAYPLAVGAGFLAAGLWALVGVRHGARTRALPAPVALVAATLVLAVAGHGLLLVVLEMMLGVVNTLLAAFGVPFTP